MKYLEAEYSAMDTDTKVPGKTNQTNIIRLL